MKVSDFDYNLPPEFIAQTPAEKRDHSKFMVLDREAHSIEHHIFFQVIDQLSPGNVLVLNDTKVMPANLVGRKEGGGAKVEVLLVRPVGSAWECLVKPGKRLSIGSRVIFGEGEVVGKVLEKTESGEQIIEFEGNLDKYMHKAGEIPLPPYIRPQDLKTSRPQDLESRYQTVYAEREGASAAPTAGLHFTPELLKKIDDKGVKIARITLHTGLATFKPVYVENVEEHKMYTEYYEVPEETARAIREAARVVAVGTTTVRTLESCYQRILSTNQRIAGETELFIYPGYEFKVVDAIITNFHFPRSTLLMMISAFAGKEFIFRAYQEAMDKGYRFFSFGDAMFIK